VGPLFFDPQGADSTSWIIRFKNAVYRNWIVPQDTLANAKGHVDFEFVVDGNGSLSALRKLRSTVPIQLEEAAENALRRSQFAVLPPDYPEKSVRMRVTFFYKEQLH